MLEAENNSVLDALVKKDTVGHTVLHYCFGDIWQLGNTVLRVLFDRPEDHPELQGMTTHQSLFAQIGMPVACVDALPTYDG